MIEYIKMPSWITGWEDIKSNNLRNFRNSILEQKDNKIDINYLRNYYIKNKDSFRDVVDELALRGFEFYTVKLNNLFYKNTYEKGEYIISNINSKFLKLDFESFSLGNFLSRFKVENNEFFNNIPLEGFKILNPEINIEDFKKELYKNGFEVRKILSKNESLSIDKKYNLVDIYNCTPKLYLEHKGKEKDNMTEEECNIIKVDNKNYEESIEKYFSDNAYLSVMKFLSSTGIKSITEITNETLINFCKSRGTGEAKIKKFVNRLIEIYQYKRDYGALKYNIFDIDFCFCSVNLQDAREFFKFKLNLNDIGEITDKHIDMFGELKGVTKRKVEIVREKIEEFNQIERAEPIKRQINVIFKGYWYEKYKNFKIKELAEIIGLKNEINIELTLEEINEKDLIKLGLEKFESEIMNINNIINDTKALNEIFEEAVNFVKNNQQNVVLEERYINGSTLATIGDILNVTRERVRQIQKRTEEKIAKFILNNNLYEALILEFENRDFCALNELTKYTPKGKEYYCKILSKNIKQLYYFKPLNLIYFKKFEGIEEKILSIIKELPDLFIIYDYLDFLIDELSNVGLINITIEYIEELLINYNYRIYGEYASNRRLTILECLDQVFKNHIMEPIRVDGDGVEKIIKLVKKYFNEEYDKSIRAIEARIRDNREIILVDRLTFIHISNYEFNRKCLEKIYNFIKEVLLTKEVINIEYIFENNKDECINGGIKNKIALYSLIQYYYSEDFKVGRGNTLDIYRNTVVDLGNREEMLIKTIKENGGKITKDEINKELGWTDFKIENAISDSNVIVRYGKVITTLDYFNISELEKTEIRKILDQMMGEDGFTTSKLLLKEMKFNYILGNLISRNNIVNHEILPSIIKKMFKDINGHTNYIYNGNCKYKNIEEVIKNKFKDVFYREDVKEFIYSYGYKELMASISINNAIESGVFIEISSEKLVNKEDFYIKEDVIEELINYIEMQFGNYEYLVLSGLKGYRNILPQIDYRWSPQLIKSILIRNGFRSIKRVYQDPRFEKVIVVKENSSIKSYSDLIYSVIKNEYHENMHESKIYDFLADKGLVIRQDNIFDKKIPYDLRGTGKVKIDEVGRVELL